MSAEEQYQKFISDLLEPPKEESVVDWAAAHVNLPSGAVRGRFSLRLAPYGAEILERFGDRRTKNLVMCFSAQSAKTTLIVVGMLYRLCRMPQDTMWVMPNADLAKSFSKARWMKFIMECQPSLALVPRTASGEIDRHLFSFTEQYLTSQYLKFVGSNSPANLSSFPCGAIVMDEVDKFPSENKFEAGALDTAKERVKTYPFPFVVAASTPTVVGRMIWPEFEKTDQRYYWLPCPRCGRQILLKFTIKSEQFGDCGLRWWRENEDEAKTDSAWDMAKVAQQAYYKCQECGGEIADSQSMLGSGIWKPSNPLAEEGNFGYHLSSLYSVLSQKTSFSSIAIQWLQSKSLISARQNFINSWLAEVWDSSRMFDEREMKLETYTSQDIAKDSVAILTIDVQQNSYWAVCRRWAGPSKDRPDGESWLLFADQVQTEDELAELQKEYGVNGENVLLDLAHKPNQTGRLIIEHDWRGIWGSDTKSFWHPQPNGTRVERIFSTVFLRDPALGTKWESRTPLRVRYVKFSVSGALDVLSTLRYADPPIWHINVNVNPAYARQLNSRQKMIVQNKRTGRMEPIWKNVHNEDHLGDCENFQIIRAIQLGLIRLPGETAEEHLVK
jgi:DNA-directed RNA polymerase subunit RPC12/RpoP